MSGPVEAPGRRSKGVESRVVWAWIVRWRVEIAVALGVVFRLVEYLHRRGYWQDEGAVVMNIRRLSPLGFFGPLEFSQLAPPGFLVADWLGARLLGGDELGMRLVPFLGGIASLFLFLGVARRVLPPRAVYPAVLLFAVADDLIYFSTEVKQYSTDVMWTLACFFAALTDGSRPLTPSRTLRLAAAGALVLWFSHPTIFVLASIGTVLLARELGVLVAIKRADWARQRAEGRPSWRLRFEWPELRGLLACSALGVAWLGSFAAVHEVAYRQLGTHESMWSFWGFSFPEYDPGVSGMVLWTVRRVGYFFVNPLMYEGPIDRRLAFVPGLLAILGAWRLARRDGSRFAILALPVAFALVAAAIRAYPFHGRLVLYLVPTYLLFIAAGLDRLGDIPGRRVGVPIRAVAWLLVVVIPCASAILQLERYRDREFNPHGDRRSMKIDPNTFPF